MTEEEFNQWLFGLDLQTLTDELKETIAEKVSEVVELEKIKEK